MYLSCNEAFALLATSMNGEDIKTIKAIKIQWLSHGTSSVGRCGGGMDFVGGCGLVWGCVCRVGSVGGGVDLSVGVCGWMLWRGCVCVFAWVRVFALLAGEF